MPFDDEVLRVKIMAKEYTEAVQGTRLYLVQAIEIGEARFMLPSSGLWGEPTSPISVPLASFEQRFARLLAAVKGDDPNPLFDIDEEDPWARLLRMAEAVQRPEGQKVHELPRTFEAAGMETGTNLFFTPTTILTGLKKGAR